MQNNENQPPAGAGRSGESNNNVEFEEGGDELPAGTGDGRPLVAAIGASAGGLDAFRELFSHLPPDTGLAYVLIQHMAKGSSSVLTDILQRETAMSVVAPVSGSRVQANTLYVMPPSHDMLIRGGRLHLIERQEGERHLPIDTFFASLAEDMAHRAIGIVLSGTASDGVIGLKRIKAAGGLTFAQSPESAAYPDMPRSAIAAHCVDFIRTPRHIAEELARLGRPGEDRAADGDDEAEGLPNLNPILQLLRSHTGHDFSYYKRTTLQRRIERQMGLHGIQTLEDYTDFLTANPGEVGQLFEEILINVTGFFRDPEIFAYLKETVFPPLLKQLPPRESLRVWVPGCSSGEEPYSLAICLLETMQACGVQAPLKIFATDIDQHAVRLAREGRYPERIAERLTPAQLEKYFTPVENGYRIKRSIRELCVFAVHNVVTDPPFSRIDLISCRNLLIYLGQILQKKLIPLFHYALKPGGHLLLGLSETIGRHADLFTAVDNTYKLYRKVAIPSPPLDLPSAPAIHAHKAPVQSTPRPAHDDTQSIEHQVEHLLLDKYAPPGVLIDSDMNILQFRGQLGSYLEPAPGKASLNLLRMARDALVPELRAAVVRAINKREVVQRQGIRIQAPLRALEVNLTVLPLEGEAASGNHYLVLFEETGGDVGQADIAVGEASPEEVTRLREELAATKEYLHSVIEQQEIANEEARSANEEIQASNEELQSINEELETAKEELQSSNEELGTVNEELDTRNRELERSNDDLQNLISSVNLPLLMVGTDLRIRLFTPQARKVFNLIPEDLGRPITDLHQKIPVAELDRHLRNVIETLEPYSREVQDPDGGLYELNIRPYRTADSRIDGAVMVFLNIDARYQSLEDVRQARDYSHVVVAALPLPLLVLDEELRVEQASEAFLQLFRLTRDHTLGSQVFGLGSGAWSTPALLTALREAINAGQAFSDLDLDDDAAGEGHRRLRFSGQPLQLRQDGPRRVLLRVHPLTTE